MLLDHCGATPVFFNPWRVIKWPFLYLNMKCFKSVVVSNADLTNFMVTRDNQLQWCVENQRVWIALRGAEFPGHANPQSNRTNNDSAMENGFDDGEQSALFASVSQAISWLVAGTDPLIPPSSTGGYPLPGFISEAKRIQVLVCGSLHLVGITMKVLGPEIVGNM